MKIDNMRELYEELLRATSNGYRNRSIANPAVDFTKKAKAGDFDEMSDEEYYQALDKVNELNDVWQHRPSGQIGELLFTALENLTLSDSDVEDMAATLLCAYERSSKEHIPCDAKAADRNERTAGYAASKEIDSDNPSKTKTQSDKRSTDAKGILSSPAKIYEYLDRRVYGQKEAKRAAAMLLWNHVNGRRQNVLFAGPTGCGKTEIFRQLAKLYPNIVIHNATSLTGAGWKPYYLYRQKYMAGNLENVGYAKPGKACLYNIGNMEETASVLALGAGAISKWLFNQDERAVLSGYDPELLRFSNIQLRIERAANVRNIEQYVSRVDEMIARKREMIFPEARA